MERFSAAAIGPARDFLNGLQRRPHLAPMWDMDARFRSMDAAGDYQQILTLSLPPIEQITSGPLASELARLANDQMAALVGRYPDRFLGFAAALPMEQPDAASEELDRATHELGALGAQVFTNVNGRALDDPRYDPLWYLLAERDLTLWVHGARRSTTPDYIGENISRLGMWASLGWPYEMGLFAARMVASGVLDRYPNLRIYLHHSGGMTPTFGRRVNGSWLELQTPAVEDEAAYAALKRPVADYFNLLYADTSGQTPIAITAAIEFFGIEHVMLGSDAPFGPLENHLATLAHLDLSDSDRALLTGGNAQRVLLRR